MSTKRQTIYIAHPFTTHGDPAENMALQKAIGEAVFNAGFIPVSPILAFGEVIPHDKANYEAAMQACFWLLERCDMVFFLGDWVHSRGCRMEWDFAVNHAIPIRTIVREHYEDGKCIVALGYPEIKAPEITLQIYGPQRSFASLPK